MDSSNFGKYHAFRSGNDFVDTQFVPNADVISLETIVHMLVAKGVCTAEELFMLEGRVQDLNHKSHGMNFVSIQNQLDRGRFPGLKKAMSKHRWSRRLGTLLFGWKWKKVKKF
ncbi:MAG: hypothetical protein ONB31_01305 [candidate division KSB1 bacterium]|nr:hypothetical protein [candidate division KSB1 bacterium]MDZ7336588.1 hypothetical protein [candidate division KSB1 bacterium]MDZ7358879.1 hypothetical protein [candidate division KSB1 bacterium]MDZ7401339.1 hypothetical protein [candidate division KSB1 bacterium]